MEPTDDLVRRRIEDHIALSRALLDDELATKLTTAANRIVQAYEAGHKLLLFGNGGSAADAQHIAAEMCGRFLLERRPLPAIALGDNVAAVTAIGNDFGFADIFARQVQALGSPGDVAIAISTSGRSENIIRGVQAARGNGIFTVALTGAQGGPLRDAAELCVWIPSVEVPRIQEAQALVGHILCELVENALFAADP